MCSGTSFEVVFAHSLGYGKHLGVLVESVPLKEVVLGPHNKAALSV